MTLSFLNEFNIQENYLLKGLSRFSTGGAAQYYFKPTSICQLHQFLLKWKDLDSRPCLTVLGGFSNVLIRDGGIDGIVIHLNIPSLQFVKKVDLLNQLINNVTEKTSIKDTFLNVLNRVPNNLQSAEHFLSLKAASQNRINQTLQLNSVLQDSLNDDDSVHNFDYENVKLIVSAGTFNALISSFARKYSIANFEFLMSIPGTIGGSIKGNSGCYGTEISDVFFSCYGFDLNDFQFKFLTKNEAGFSYRSSLIPKNFIILYVVFDISKGEQDKIIEKIKQNQHHRLTCQPIDAKTCGSTFKNPVGYKAWELIKNAGCGNLQINSAVISSLHNNFIINSNNATSKDIEDLANLVQKKVFEKFQIELEWEIIRIGKI